MPDSTTPQGPFFDGMGMKAVINYMKDYHDANMGSGGSSQIPYPGLQVEYNNDNDYCTVYCTTGYEGIESEVTLGYTTDGTTPSVSSPEFVSPQRIEKNCTLMVRAFVAVSTTNIIESPSNSVIISGLKCQNVQYAFNSGTKQVTLTCPTQGATIRYTTNGADPDEHSTVYEGPFTVTTTTVVKAVATKIGLLDSDILTSTAKTANVFGVMWDYSVPSPQLTRLTPDTDPYGYVTVSITTEPVPEKTGQAGSSPFDQYNPWAGMKRRNFGPNENNEYVPGVWEGEAGFTTSGKDTLVYIPKYWYDVEDDSVNSLRYYYVADDKVAGLEVHPGSDQYVAAYPTSNNNESRSGATGVTVSTTVAEFKEYAQAKGPGWGLIDLAEISAIQFLYLSEFATWDSQTAIGTGTPSGTIGDTEALQYHTGCTSDGAVRYRWISDLWGRLRYFVDGVNIITDLIFINTDRNTYEFETSIGYTEYSELFDSGFITKTVFNPDIKWAIGIPLKGSTAGSGTTFLSDMADKSSGTYANDILTFGWPSGALDAGIFTIGGTSISSSTTQNCSRLSWKTPKAKKPVFTITYNPEVA